MNQSFEHLLLPIRCPACNHEVHASLAELISRPVELACDRCGGSIAVDAREPAARVGSALWSRFAATRQGLDICTVALAPSAR